MDIVNSILGMVINVLNTILPALNVSDELMTKIDSAMSLLIEIINAAGYFIPLDVLLLCFSSILIFDNAMIFFRLGQWILKFIRG